MHYSRRGKKAFMAMIQDQGFWVELEPSDNRLGLLITQLWFPPSSRAQSDHV